MADVAEVAASCRHPKPQRTWAKARAIRPDDAPVRISVCWRKTFCAASSPRPCAPSLQGALGERITRNVRKLVRREIRLVLAADELD
jgi:hypothetical protein